MIKQQAKNLYLDHQAVCEMKNDNTPNHRNYWVAYGVRNTVMHLFFKSQQGLCSIYV